MRVKNVFIHLDDGRYESMFLSNGWGVVDSVSKADLVLFTGGNDVTPELYGCDKHASSICNISRDISDINLWIEAFNARKPMAGICRGAQFLNVMNGGKLYQDVTNHAISGTHSAFEPDSKETFEVTSTHHQMIIPSPKGKVLLCANVHSDKVFFENAGKYSTRSSRNGVEAVYYEHTNSLCYQPHPEHVGVNHPCQKKFFEYLIFM